MTAITPASAYVGSTIPRTEYLRRKLGVSNTISTLEKPSGFNAFSQHASDMTKATETPSLLSRLLSKTPKSVQNTATNLITWGKAPISESPIYQGISDGASKGLTKLAVKASVKAAENTAEKGFFAKLIGKVAGYVAPAAKSTEGFLGKMGGVAAGGGVFTKGNVAIAAAFEATDVIEGFKEGRGIRQTVQSATKVGAGVAGGLAATAGAVALGVISGPVGWAALGIGAVGSAIGYMVGGKATSFLGHNQKGLFEKAQVAEVPATQQANAQFGSKTMPANGAVTPIPFDFNNPLPELAHLGAGI